MAKDELKLRILRERAYLDYLVTLNGMICILKKKKKKMHIGKDKEEENAMNTI